MTQAPSAAIPPVRASGSSKASATDCGEEARVGEHGLELAPPRPRTGPAQAHGGRGAARGASGTTRRAPRAARGRGRRAPASAVEERPRRELGAHGDDVVGALAGGLGESSENRSSNTSAHGVRAGPGELAAVAGRAARAGRVEAVRLRPGARDRVDARRVEERLAGLHERGEPGARAGQRVVEEQRPVREAAQLEVRVPRERLEPAAQEAADARVGVRQALGDALHGGERLRLRREESVGREPCASSSAASRTGRGDRRVAPDGTATRRTSGETRRSGTSQPSLHGANARSCGFPAQSIGWRAKRPRSTTSPSTRYTRSPTRTRPSSTRDDGEPAAGAAARRARRPHGRRRSRGRRGPGWNQRGSRARTPSHAISTASPR